MFPEDITASCKFHNNSGVAYRIGKLVNVAFEDTITSVATNAEVIPKLPIPKTNGQVVNLGMANGQTLTCIIQDTGLGYARVLQWHPASNVAPSRIDSSFSYVIV